MDTNDSFLVAIGWVHMISASTWIGGSAFYLLILNPTRRKCGQNTTKLMYELSKEFRLVVNLCIVALVATGVILAFNRLTFGEIGLDYTITLSIKILLTIWMFLLVRKNKTHARIVQFYSGEPEPSNTIFGKINHFISSYNWVLILGILVFLLSEILEIIFEFALQTN